MRNAGEKESRICRATSKKRKRKNSTVRGVISRKGGGGWWGGGCLGGLFWGGVWGWGVGLGVWGGGCGWGFFGGVGVGLFFGGVGGGLVFWGCFLGGGSLGGGGFWGREFLSYRPTFCPLERYRKVRRHSKRVKPCLPKKKKATAAEDSGEGSKKWFLKFYPAGVGPKERGKKGSRKNGAEGGGEKIA